MQRCLSKNTAHLLLQKYIFVALKSCLRGQLSRFWIRVCVKTDSLPAFEQKLLLWDIFVQFHYQYEASWSLKYTCKWNGVLFLSKGNHITPKKNKKSLIISVGGWELPTKTHMDGDISVHTLWEHTRPPGPTVEWDGLNPTHWTTLELREDRKNGGGKTETKM